jgi:uncharacterized membrane protein YbhN (UPF0104 family)
VSNGGIEARPGRWGRWLAKAALSAAVLAFLLYRVDVRSVVATLGGIQPGPLVLALAAYITGQMVSAGKWTMLARALGFRRSYADYAELYFIGMFVNLLGPATVGGDLTRGLYLGGTRRRALALNSVVFDRASGLVVLIVIGSVALVAFPQYRLPTGLSILTGGVAGTLLLSWWIVPRAVALVLPAGNRLRQFIEEDLAPFWRNRILLGKVAAVSAIFHLCEVSVQYTLARALGLDVPFSYCLIFHPAVSLLAAVPISVAGLGVREGGYVFFLGLVGIPQATALALGLLWFAITVMGALPGGILLMLRNAHDEDVTSIGNESRATDARNIL